MFKAFLSHCSHMNFKKLYFFHNTHWNRVIFNIVDQNMGKYSKHYDELEVLLNSIEEDI